MGESQRADDAHLADYCYDQILALVCDLDALIRNAVELAAMYELGDVREARRLLICLIDKYLPAAAKAADAG